MGRPKEKRWVIPGVGSDRPIDLPDSIKALNKYKQIQTKTFS